MNFEKKDASAKIIRFQKVFDVIFSGDVLTIDQWSMSGLTTIHLNYKHVRFELVEKNSKRYQRVFVLKYCTLLGRSLSGNGKG